MKVVDLCAATGLFSHAFAQEGFDVVAGYELEADKATCWGLNHPGAKATAGDVLQLTTKDILRHGDPSELVLIGGVPCQDFSTANFYRKLNTQLRDHVMALVKDVGPAAYAFENVMEGWARVSHVRAVRDCDVGGYTIRVRGFWGAPPIQATHSEKGEMRLDGERGQRWNGWGGAIPGWDYAADFTQQDDWENRGTLQVRGRGQPFWTLTSKNDFALWKHSERRSLRWATVQDKAALQGFPPTWHFPKGITKTTRAIGDAVPLAMGRAVARAVRAKLGGA